MSITRTTDTDDDGSGTTGTIRTNAWLQTIYDALDGRWSRVTITSTGSQNNVSITEADLVILNNASDLTITGIVAPASPTKPGKRLILVSTGAGNVLLAHQNASSTAANRIINFATSANTPLAAGVGTAILTYDDANSRWRLVHHEQGAPITPTFADGHYTGAGVDADWALASGDRTTQMYILRGRQLFVTWYLATTSVTNTPTTLRITNAAWGGFTVAKTKLRSVMYDDNGGGNTFGYAQVTASGTEISIFKLSGNFSNAANTTNAFGDLDFEVT